MDVSRRYFWHFFGNKHSNIDTRTSTFCVNLHFNVLFWILILNFFHFWLFITNFGQKSVFSQINSFKISLRILFHLIDRCLQKNISKKFKEVENLIFAEQYLFPISLKGRYIETSKISEQSKIETCCRRWRQTDEIFQKR